MGYDELGIVLSNAILSDFDKKIKYGLSLKECLSKYTKDELIRFYFIHFIYNNDMTNLEFFRILDGKKNGKIVSEIASNVREIMYSYLCIMKTSILNVL